MLKGSADGGARNSVHRQGAHASRGGHHSRAVGAERGPQDAVIVLQFLARSIRFHTRAVLSAEAVTTPTRAERRAKDGVAVPKRFADGRARLRVSDTRAVSSSEVCHHPAPSG